MFSTAIVTLEQRAAFVDLLATRRGFVWHGLGDLAPDPGPATGQILMVRANRVVRRTTRPATPAGSSLGVNLGALAIAFAERLESGGVAVTPQQSERFVRALQAGAPPSRRSLYYLARENFVGDAADLPIFNDVFAGLFGAPAGTDRHREQAPAAALAG